MTANPCAVCGRPTPDGAVCVAESEQARQQLAEIAETVEAARAVMYRQTATGDTIHSTPGPRDLLDYGAGARLDAVQTALTGWVRAVAEDAKVKNAPREGDLIAACAEWLAERVELIRHLDYAAEILREIGDCWHAMRSVVATPAGRLYLGVCAAERQHGGLCSGGICFEDDFTDDCDCWCHRGEPDTCPGDVYGKPGKAVAYCNQCGAAYDQDERRVQITTLVDGQGFRASVIAHAYGIPVDTIRGWAWVRRDNNGVPVREPKLRPVDRDDRGRPLYLVADVLALHEQARQRREQRTAQAAGMGA